MTEKEETKTGFRKVFVFGVIAVLLFVLPAVSYLYLYKGFKWRVDAQAELQDFGKIRAAYRIMPDGNKENLLKGKVCVLHLFGENPELTAANKLILDTGEELFKQFGGASPEPEKDNFRLVMISEGGSTEFRSYAQTRPSSDMNTWVWTGGLGSWTTILKNGYEGYCVKTKAGRHPEYYAVSDTSGVIRRFYNAEDAEEVKRMVQHVALLLPK